MVLNSSSAALLGPGCSLGEVCVPACIGEGAGEGVRFSFFLGVLVSDTDEDSVSFLFGVFMPGSSSSGFLSPSMASR